MTTMIILVLTCKSEITPKFAWVLHKTLVNKFGVFIGSLWAILNARDEHDPLRTFVNGMIVY